MNKRTILIANTAGINYTAPHDGFINVVSQSTAFVFVHLRINSSQDALLCCNTLLFPVKQGDIITSDETVRIAQFIYS